MDSGILYWWKKGWVVMQNLKESDSSTEGSEQGREYTFPDEVKGKLNGVEKILSPNKSWFSFQYTETGVALDSNNRYKIVMGAKILDPLYPDDGKLWIDDFGVEKLNVRVDVILKHRTDTAAPLKTLECVAVGLRAHTYNIHPDKTPGQEHKLLNSETMFIDKETGEEFYIKQYGFFLIDVDLGLYDLNNYSYYFFDINGDENPELCISDKARFTYIMQYDEDLNRFFLWQRYETPTLILMGTQKIGISGNGKSGYFLLNEDAEYEQFLWFKVDGYRDSESIKDIYYYMVTLPQKAELNAENELSENMKNQAIFDDDQKLYYFRGTEEQYNELTKDFFEAVKFSKQEGDEFCFTYEELFNTSLSE